MVIHPTLLIVLPLIGAFSTPLLKKYGENAVKIYALIYLMLNFLLSLALFMVVEQDGPITEQIAGFRAPVGIFLAVGPVNAILALLINFLAAFNFLTYNAKEKRPFYRFSILYMLGVAASTGIVITGDLFNMFVFFEIAAVSSYALIASSRDAKADSSAIKYMILGSVGSSFFLLGIALIYSELRTLNLYDIAARMSMMDSTVKYTAFVFLLLGIGVEAELFPFNGWVPSVYGKSDGNISSYLVIAPSKAGIYAILRLSLTLFMDTHVLDIGMFFGLLTLVLGELMALGEKNIKRMLAFSSIGQMGLILIAISIGSVGGLIAAVFLMISHATAKGTLFLSSDVFKEGGMKQSLAGALTVAAVLTLVGMPPFAGFWGKWYLFTAATEKGLWLVMLTVLFTTAIEAYYLARFLYRGMSIKRITEVKTERIVAMVIMVSFALLAGLLVSVLYGMISGDAASILAGGI